MKFKAVITILILVILLGSVIYAQDISNAENTLQQAQQSKKVNTGSMANITDFNNLWDITKLAGPFRWLIFLVLAFGLGSVLYKYVDFFMDNRRARSIYNLDLKSASIREIEDTVHKNPNSLIQALFNNMLYIYKNTERAEDFHYEITNFDQLQQDKFATFQGRMSFLSDTAGALGLLGTVWGMFITFSKGILDNQVILTGMGLALVTTLMGLVTSIILNFFSTQIQAAFRRKIDRMLEKSDQLRLRMLQYQRKNRGKLGRRFEDYIDMRDKVSDENQLQQEKQELEDELFDSINEPDSEEEEGDASKLKIINTSGDEQVATVNTRLKSPFVVQVLNAEERGVSGQTVIFSIEVGNGNLTNGNKVEEIKTDSQGYARTYLILGNSAGDNVVRVGLKRNNDEFVKFKAIGVPAGPCKLLYISGNLQNSPAGQELKDPFVVKLEDTYNNPITGHQVIFKVKIGKGYFPGNKRTYVTKTDVNGVAQSYFTLRPEPGFNSINVFAKGLKRNKIEFEALGQ
ncbi:hypothetical protein GF337_12735 [candidate division KSB1 bacterium]|nr:hypothetical protein [candidate division KSB1 bacterium]